MKVCIFSRGTGRVGPIAAAVVVLAGICSTVMSAQVLASVAGDLSAIVVSDGTLTGVSVASSPAGVTMQPAAFSTATHDYALRTCAGKALTVTLNGSSLQVGAQSGSQVHVPVKLVTSQALIVSTLSSQYWFRCLPNDFPPITVASHASTSPGWYVTATVANSNAAAPAGLYGMILDSNGTPVWYMHAAGPALVDFQQLFGSTLSWTSFSSPVFSLYRYDTQTSGSITPVPTPHWASPPPTDVHELLRLSNGDVMFLAFPITTDNSANFTDASGAMHTGANIADCVIEEVNPSGHLVWSWDAYYDHHISPSETFLGGSAINGVYDVYHCNSLDLDPTASDPSQADILLSARNTDAIYRIHRSTGSVRWKLGDDHTTGTALTAAQTTGSDLEPLLASTFKTGENTIGGQHDARFDTGNTALFSFYDDHTGQPITVNGARALQFNVTDTTSSHKATETYEYTAPDSTASAFATGSYRPDRAANSGAGDNVVCWGFRNALAMTEFNNAGADLRDIYLNATASATSAGYSVYRFIKLPPTAFSADLLRQTAGLPRFFMPPVPSGWHHPGELTLPLQFGSSGVITGAGTSPAASGSGKVDTFWKGTDGNLWHASTANGGTSYNGIASLGSGPLGGSPHAVSSDSGRVDVFWKGTDGNIWDKWHLAGGTWQGPKSLGGAGTVAGDPFPVAFGTSTIAVFWKGTDGRLFNEWNSSGSWHGPQVVAAGLLASDPHPVSAGNRVAVFWKGGDGNLWYDSHLSGGPWLGQKSLGGGPLGSDPHPVSPASGAIDVFWQGTDNGLWHDASGDGVSWGGAQLIGGAGQVTAPPVPVSPATNDIDVFWRTTNPQSGARSLEEATYNGSGWSIAPAPSNTSLLTDPSPVQTATGHVAVFAESLDGTFWFQTT